MGSLSVSQIVDVLIQDTFLVTERLRFFDCLNISAAEIKQYEDRYVMGTISGYEHFTKVIGEWIKRNNTPVRLEQLKDALQKGGFMAVSEFLNTLGDDNLTLKINQVSEYASIKLDKIEAIDSIPII